MTITSNKYLLWLCGGIAVVLAIAFGTIALMTKLPSQTLVGYYTFGKQCVSDAECVCTGDGKTSDVCGKPGQYPGCIEGRCGFMSVSAAEPNDLSSCAIDSDCIVMGYSGCCASETAINKKYEADYQSHPEWGSKKLNCELVRCAQLPLQPTKAECKDTFCRVVSVNDASATANWQTYRNEEYGFEIMYPENWPVDFAANILTLGDSKVSGYTKCYVTITLKGSKAEGSILPTPYKYNYYAQIEEGDKCESTLKQILSTFKFIESADTSTLRNYRNEASVCAQDNDCVVRLCSGPMTVEQSRNLPPDLPCIMYDGYSAVCIAARCAAVKK